MKIKSIITIFGALTFGLTLQSCSDFLTESNPNYLSTDTYYENLDECSGALNAVYSSFMEPENFTSALAENLRSDMCVQAQVSRASFTNEAYLQTFNDSFNDSSKKWANIYTGIFRANQVLKGLEGLDESEVATDIQKEEYTQIKAQALCLRGLFYFWLNSTFNGGSVPYLDSVSQEEADFYNNAISSDRIKAYFRQDLNEAIDLGLNSSWSGGDLGRITSWAAKAILGKSYLYEEDYEMARKYFKEIIDSKEFQLMENIGDNFTSDNEFNAESLLEVSYSSTYNTEFGDWSTATQYNIFGMNFSKKNGWLTVIPPFWIVEEFEQKELVDSENPINWVEMKGDSYSLGDGYDSDVIYEQSGKTYGDEYVTFDETLGEEVIYRYAFVYHQTTAGTYDGNVYKRLEILDKETGELHSGVTTSNPLYTTMYNNANYNPHDEVTIKWVAGVPMRLRHFTPRASYSVVLNGDIELLYYQKSNNENAAYQNEESGYYRKHTNWDKWDGEQSGTPAKASSINFRMIRLADIYLMYAEALIEGGSNEGGFAEAMMYVNRVRERGGAVLIGSENLSLAEFNGQRNYQDTVVDSASGNTADSGVNTFVADAKSLMTHLMYKERPLELCVEGNAIRAIDLKRWGVTKSRFTSLAQQKFVFSTIHYLTPEDDTDDATTDYDDTKMLMVGNNGGRQCRAYLYPEEVSYADFVEAAVNYNEKVADWPIPLYESTSNPYITE